MGQRHLDSPATLSIRAFASSLVLSCTTKQGIFIEQQVLVIHIRPPEQQTGLASFAGAMGTGKPQPISAAKDFCGGTAAEALAAFLEPQSPSQGLATAFSFCASQFHSAQIRSLFEDRLKRTHPLNHRLIAARALGGGDNMGAGKALRSNSMGTTKPPTRLLQESDHHYYQAPVHHVRFSSHLRD
ncbi:hypothetical protein B0T17DRAFT_510628 [Bombardia bombarda]|uniref:Uncharacterized protein n=1 Tax=Bombardia bombarda TaxID=252184 RepID=A0AA39WIL0_9PEZI|nr:hypothetical protein B0T17DRAFT_510628 [Bombardia bombarda]